MGFLLPAFIVVVLDQATKQFFWHLGRNFDLIDGVLRITLAKNTGAAFSMFQGHRFFFIIASVLASAVILLLGLITPINESKKRLAFSLILGGAVGNLIDRILAGEVIDFVDMGIGFHRWPVYNVADIAVTAGVVLLLVCMLGSRKSENGG